MAGVLLALFCVLCMSAFLTVKCKIPAGFAPLVTLCGAALWFSAAGMLGVLWAGGLLWYLLCAAALVFTLACKPWKNKTQPLRSPALALFALAGLCAVLYLGIRQPLLHEWDEFSLWGTAVKLIKLNNELYTTASTGFAWPSTQVPALPVLGYFAQFFGSYAAWKIYAAYALLLLAVVAALVGAVPFRQYQLAVPLGIIGLLTPWFFTIYNREYRAAFVWLSSYGDLPAGMLFGGVLLLYYGLRRQKAPLWPVLPVLATLALVKENTFVFALAAAGVMALDLLLVVQDETGQEQPFFAGVKSLYSKKAAPYPLGNEKQPLLKRVATSALFLASGILPYMVWSRYIGGVVAARQAAGLVDPTSKDPVSAVGTGLKMLLGLSPRSNWFSETLNAMWNSFFWGTLPADPTKQVLGGAQLSMLGGGLIIVLLITLLFLLAFLLAKQGRGRLLIAYFGMLVCFWGYSLELLISYAFILDESQGLIPSYNRYISCYYIGWFLLAVFFVVQAAFQRQKVAPLRVFAAQGVVLVLAGAMLLRSNMLLPLQNSDVGYATAVFNGQRAEEKFAQAVSAALGEEPQRVFFVSQGDSAGVAWFAAHYYLLPHIVDYSGVPQKVEGAGGGGGTYSAPELLQGENPKSYNTYTTRELQDYITKTGCNYLYLHTLDERFTKSYGSLFADGLQAAKDGETVLYRVQGAGSGLRFVPVPMEVPIR